jgi:hypothetical protein
MPMWPSCLKIPLPFIAGLLLAAVISAYGHSGQIALAYPVQGLHVDGDFSDWPAAASLYPLAQTEYGSTPDGLDDLQATFRLGYDRDAAALYIALEVMDQSVFIDSSATGTWNTQDGCELYLDIDHGEKVSSAVQHFIYGNQHPSSADHPAGRVVEDAWQRHAGGHRYEWRIDIGRLLGSQPSGDLTIGLDLAVNDYDADSTFSWVAWSKGVRKLDAVGRRGDAVLSTQTSLSRLHGRVEWDGLDQGVAGVHILLRSTSTDRLWLTAETDLNGRFTAEVPSGAYALYAPADAVKGRPLILEPGSTDTVTTLLQPGTASHKSTTPPRVTVAGMGIRQGVWQNYGVADGLPNGYGNALLQSRDGVL